MKLTDMNLICLEECFEYLELRDLLSVSDANKRLRRAAEFIFIQKYSKRPVFFDIAKKSQFPYTTSKSTIKLKGDLKTSFRLLRCFGHMTNDVEFFFNGSHGEDHCRAEQLDQLNQYCADSLINFSLYVHPLVPQTDKWEMFTKPFTRAEKVSIVNCYLVERGEKFARLFPKIKELKHFGMKEHDCSYMLGQYPQLEYLSIDIMKHTTSLLHLNPQLKKLRLSNCVQSFCDEFTFRNCIEPMQNLEELTLCSCNEILINFMGNKIKSKSIKKFAISSGNRQKYPFLFDQLETFKIGSTELTSHFYDFIDQHPTITKLDIFYSFFEKENVNFSRISKALPSLIELNFSMYNETFSERFSVNDFLCCVSGFGSLKKLCFKRLHYSSDTFYDELQTRMADSPLADQWRVLLDYNCSCLTSFVLERLDHQTSQ